MIWRALDITLVVLELAILTRVLYSWVDPNPYPTNEFKRILWAVTDPILEPLRRFVPPVGMIDFTPLVAILVLVLLRSVVGALAGP